MYSCPTATAEKGDELPFIDVEAEAVEDCSRPEISHKAFDPHHGRAAQSAKVRRHASDLSWKKRTMPSEARPSNA